MAETYLTPQTTSAGKAMIVKSLNGGSITFTKIVIGNGKPGDGEVAAMVNPLLTVAISASESHDTYILLTGECTSADVNSKFYGNELGVYAKDADGNEQLYAYRYSTEDVDFFPDASTGRTMELRMSIVVQIGNAKNVTAILTEGEAYALKDDFEAHVKDGSNPHKVTAEQVGLGNVDNEAASDLTPDFTEASVRENIASGEKMSVLMGKIKKFFSDISAHFSATNPHGITPAMIGASSSSHTHAASDITSGALGIARGGTGASTAAQAANNVLSQGASSVTGDIVFSKNGNHCIGGVMADNDAWRVIGAGSADDGYMEIATADNGNEPIIIRQYADSNVRSGLFTQTWRTIGRTGYLLDGSGNTQFPGSCTATSHPTYSDRKLKNVHGDITEEEAQNIIMGLDPVDYDLKDDEQHHARMGFIAQDVYALFKKLGVTDSAVYRADERRKSEKDVIVDTCLLDDEIDKRSDEDLSWTIDYQQLIAPMIKVIQTQQKQIDELQKKVEELAK